MIVRMAKITVMGPQELLMETLTLIQDLGIMQVDEEPAAAHEDEGPPPVPMLMDKESVLQHRLHEKVSRKIDELLLLIPSPLEVESRQYPLISVETLVTILPSHLDEVRKRHETISDLHRRIAEHVRYGVFLDALDGLDESGERGDVQCIGVQIGKQKDIEILKEYLDQEYGGKAAFESLSGGDGEETIGVVVVESQAAEKARGALEERRVLLFAPPDGLDSLPYSQQREKVAAVLREMNEQLAQLEQEQEGFAARWAGAYRQTRAWIDSRMSLISLTAAVVKTRMCFFIHGWLAVADFALLEERLREKFQGRVVIEENELVEEDFSKIPTALHNPAYFQPFELFTRLLPMPPYASFDMTPFIGIFFPVFFGMMLGDVGYGLILFCCSVLLIRRFADRRNYQDAGKILFISSLYTIVFGFLYGELFGTVGHAYLNLKPLFFDRQTSIIPMLCFAVAAGVVHVIIGLVLGVIVSLRRKMTREAVFKLVNIFIILCICVLTVSYFTSSVIQVQKPLLLTIAVVIPMLLLVGGVMAPLELLKNIGNIISYARIMAVGLTSVLLAFVANYMAGRIGSVWAGIIVALLLHLFNLMLGVFAPTIHSLRLHYVEFLSKFMEPGGKEFKPLGRKQ